MDRKQFKERVVGILTNGGMDRLTDLLFELVKSGEYALGQLEGAIDLIETEDSDDEELADEEASVARDAARELKGALLPFQPDAIRAKRFPIIESGPVDAAHPAIDLGYESWGPPVECVTLADEDINLT